MDLAEAFVPSSGAGGASDESLVKTDYFDFVVSPPSHSDPSASNDENFLSRSNCRSAMSFLSDSCSTENSFIKETNNNTLTALPPVSTITGSLGHMSHRRQGNTGNNCHINSTNDHLSSTQDCNYWVPEDTKEQTCNILLEDLNKYCWSQPSHHSSNEDHHQQQQHHHHHQQQQHHQGLNHQSAKNTDGAIYTLTVLKSEPNSMDGLDGCCKSPAPGLASDAHWGFKTNHLDLDAILNMEGTSIATGSTDSTTDDMTDSRVPDSQSSITNGQDQYTAVSTSQFTADNQNAFTVTVKAEPGDNNNDWKLSDRNNLADAVTAAQSAESLLRNALTQGKLYTASPVTSTTTINATAATMLVDGQTQIKDEPMQTCSEEDLLLSQLNVEGTYRTDDYDKLKTITGDVVDSYCNLESVCNVGQTTVMYALDPTSGSLSTITLPADFSQLGTVTVVTASSLTKDLLQETKCANQQQMVNQATSTQVQLPTSGTTKAKAKKYCRRPKSKAAANNAANSAGQIVSTTGTNQQVSTTTQGVSGTTNSTSAAQARKERSLHYCSICSKGFKDKYSVNVHIRTHTGEKPFACSLCGKSFRQKAHLAKHYQTHVTQKANLASNSSNTNNNSGSNTNSGGSGNNSRGAPSPSTSTNTEMQQVATNQNLMVPVQAVQVVTAIKEEPLLVETATCTTAS